MSIYVTATSTSACMINVSGEEIIFHRNSIALLPLEPSPLFTRKVTCAPHAYLNNNNIMKKATYKEREKKIRERVKVIYMQRKALSRATLSREKSSRKSLPGVRAFMKDSRWWLLSFSEEEPPLDSSSPGGEV